MKNKAFTLIELLVLIAIVCILATMAVGFVGGCSVSDGNRSGILQKFSHKGIVNKSYEGELLLGGLISNGQTTVANVWRFSVTDKEVAKQLEQLLGKTIIVRYHQTLMYNPVTVDTTYKVISVELKE